MLLERIKAHSASLGDRPALMAGEKVSLESVALGVLDPRCAMDWALGERRREES